MAATSALQPEILENAHRHLLVGDIILGDEDAGLAEARSQREARHRVCLGGRASLATDGRLQDFLQLLPPHRLGQGGHKAGFRSRGLFARLAQGQAHHQPGVPQVRVGLDGPGQRSSIHAGQLHINEGNRERVLGDFGLRQRLQGGRAIGSLNRPQPPGLQQAEENLPIDGAVIDD